MMTTNPVASLILRERNVPQERLRERNVPQERATVLEPTEQKLRATVVEPTE
ncbi:MAG: hypothetical protein ACYTFW_00540 [Planctomycetota bacterium]|jgi:hypothetical protein